MRRFPGMRKWSVRGEIAGLLAVAVLTACGSSDDGASPMGPVANAGTTSGAGSSAGGSAGASGGTGGGAGGSTAGSANAGVANGGAAGSSGAAGADVGGAGGMAGSAGAGGSGGGGGGAALQIAAQQRDGLHVFDLGGESIFEVDGMTGARIVTFSIDGTNILTGPANNAMFYGSTLWTGPEQEWASLNPQTFTPVPGIDSDPYTMSIEQGSIIVAESAPFMVVAKELTATKRFSYDLTKSAVVIDYTLSNVGAAAFDIGLWEVTRVLGQGVTFYPTGANQTTLYGSLAVTAMAGHDWIDHAAFTVGEASKVGSDGTGGWVAHVQADAAGPLLFIKQYPDIADGMAAPQQHEIEVFEQSDASYIELELHGAYGSIPAGMTKSMQVRWYLRRLPVGTDISVGSAALIEAVATAIQ